ncbi:N-acetyltransferase [Dermatophilus congolensis]|uniref:N-acetyltransferase n=1 Tax=Dermatophilus congolensis TaxID=1863 RepID=UPI001AAF31E1|nr:N-acetyltransferase [Dermatophilus congolensis]MBO3151866.1 N-acetyltransferase [Dermatophilus congolensis]MBO3176704.1 N-acetyltransferase [Dermatophilus congolensis]
MTTTANPHHALGRDVWTAARHPLARFLRGLAAGEPIPNDGAWTRVTPWGPNIQAILCFGTHSILAVSYDFTDNQLEELGVNGGPEATSARVLSHLAGPTGWIGAPNMLMLADGTGNENGDSEPLVSRPDLNQRPTVEIARRTMTEVQVLGHPNPEEHDVVVIGNGVGGLRGIAVEIAPERRGQGHGPDLLHRALASIPENEVIASAVFAGDAAMAAAFMAKGFTHIGSIQYFSSRPERR